MGGQLPQIGLMYTVVGATLTVHQYVYTQFQEHNGFVCHEVARYFRTAMGFLQHLLDDFEAHFSAAIEEPLPRPRPHRIDAER